MHFGEGAKWSQAIDLGFRRTASPRILKSLLSRACSLPKARQASMTMSRCCIQTLCSMCLIRAAGRLTNTLARNASLPDGFECLTHGVHVAMSLAWNLANPVPDLGTPEKAVKESCSAWSHVPVLHQRQGKRVLFEYDTREVCEADPIRCPRPLLDFRVHAPSTNTNEPHQAQDLREPEKF